MIDMKCPQCGQELHINEKYAGKVGRCQHCQQKITVPSRIDWKEVELPEPTSGTGLTSIAPPALPKRRGMPRPLEIFFMVVGMITCVGLIGTMGLFVLGIALLAQSPEMQDTFELIENAAPKTVPSKIPTVREAQTSQPERGFATNPVANSSEAASVESQIRQFAAFEYPNDSQTQQYVYNQQISAYRYMQSVSDVEVNQIALREYPNDYSMQQYVYDNQLAAKRYMTTVVDREVIQIALREYPNDFSMQKFVYDNQVSAKQYMATVSNQGARRNAMREYPNDYSMQKYIYERALREQ